MDKEPEVFDVKDMNGASPMQKGLAVFLMIMSLLYTVSPIDLAPDAIPVVGWLDDIGIASFALSYIFSQMDKKKYYSLLA